MDRFGARANSFEQDLLWSVLDQDAVPQILAMASERWNVDSATAFHALQTQAELGRLRAYRGPEVPVSVDLTQTSLADAAANFELFVEPTDATRARLNEIATALAAQDSKPPIAGR